MIPRPRGKRINLERKKSVALFAVRLLITDIGNQTRLFATPAKFAQATILGNYAQPELFADIPLGAPSDILSFKQAHWVQSGP